MEKVVSSLETSSFIIFNNLLNYVYTVDEVMLKDIIMSIDVHILYNVISNVRIIHYSWTYLICFPSVINVDINNMPENYTTPVFIYIMALILIDIPRPMTWGTYDSISYEKNINYLHLISDADLISYIRRFHNLDKTHLIQTITSNEVVMDTLRAISLTFILETMHDIYLNSSEYHFITDYLSHISNKQMVNRISTVFHELPNTDLIKSATFY
jgi:hypothetical protein